MRWSWVIEYCRELDDRPNDRHAFHEDSMMLGILRGANLNSSLN
jgi:hypothetical protein